MEVVKEGYLECLLINLYQKRGKNEGDTSLENLKEVQTKHKMHVDKVGSYKGWSVEWKPDHEQFTLNLTKILSGMSWYALL